MPSTKGRLIDHHIQHAHRHPIPFRFLSGVVEIPRRIEWTCLILLELVIPASRRSRGSWKSIKGAVLDGSSLFPSSSFLITSSALKTAYPAFSTSPTASSNTYLPPAKYLALTHTQTHIHTHKHSHTPPLTHPRPLSPTQAHTP